ncbi:MAG: riboflavin synthase [Ginsengibacter sp.]
MFTGIIESQGKIVSVENQGANKTFWIESAISSRLKIDESLSHNGICLTIEEIQNNTHRVTAIKETIDKTNIEEWKQSDIINLERSMLMNGRIDGHMVQGHIDTKVKCLERKEMNGSWEFTFEFNKKFAFLVIEKGSICINGVSLTAFNVRNKKFTVAIIPYTFEHTNFSGIQKGSTVNIEFDIIGKYVTRITELRKTLG